mgnify:CR=1 FL=1
MGTELFDKVKANCRIAANITVYDREITDYLEDCREDLRASGVPEKIVQGQAHYPQLVTAASLYVQAYLYLDDDRFDTEKCLALYRKKVSRMILEEGGDDVE